MVLSFGLQEGSSMALTPTEEASYALGYGVSRSDLSPGAQIEYDRLVAEGHGVHRYERQRAAEEERRKAGQAAKEAARREATIDAMSFKWDYPVLKVFVRNGKVVRPTLNDGKVESRILGDFKGAKAGVTGTRRRAGVTVAAVVAFGPVGLAALASGQAVVYIAFPDGTLHETAVKGNKDLRQAELEVVRFNAAAEPEGEAGRSDALAASSQPAEGFAGDTAHGSAEDPAQKATGVAAELERLVALHVSGMLDDEEFRAAKARIIRGG